MCETPAATSTRLSLHLTEHEPACAEAIIADEGAAINAACARASERGGSGRPMRESVRAMCKSVRACPADARD